MVSITDNILLADNRRKVSMFEMTMKYMQNNSSRNQKSKSQLKAGENKENEKLMSTTSEGFT